MLGYICALSAFTLWGLVPIYWKQIEHITSLELLGHRILWGVISLSIYLVLKFKKETLSTLKKEFSKTFIWSSLFIFANWFIFMWAINNNHILDASLGYYLNPLINILLGRVIFKEKITLLKAAAVFIAFIGVGLLFYHNSDAIWISLSLAITFASYGVIKKKSKAPANISLYFEMLLWLPIALVYFVYLNANSSLLVLTSSHAHQFLVFLAGAVTIAPLWLFGYAIKKINLGTIGFLQFLAPTMQFLLGALVYAEALDQTKLLSFGFIWAGLIVYTYDSIRIQTKK